MSGRQASVANFPIPDDYVGEGGEFEQPLSLVEVRRLAGPVDVMGFEPDGPFAGVLARQKAG